MLFGKPEAGDGAPETGGVLFIVWCLVEDGMGGAVGRRGWSWRRLTRLKGKIDRQKMGMT